MRLRFVTTNQGKLDFLRIVLEPAARGVVDDIEMCPLELTEVQADSFAEICRQKTMEAYRRRWQVLGRLGGNVVVQESWRIRFFEGEDAPNRCHYKEHFNSWD
ncbi:unnamed protein product [Cladocopium goreaui]|uniref:Non-canonical purine NTP pyrophosphatase n=1 Tax=Cladocopium goreaui TaxID=2562237 RepID=A0A9P1M1H4_9DINO|nr:unnamed protein product [Cladocopium goreaui]